MPVSAAIPGEASKLAPQQYYCRRFSKKLPIIIKFAHVINSPIPRLTTVFHQFLSVFVRVTGIWKRIPT